MEAVGSLHFDNPPSDPNSLALRRVASSSSMLSQERNEDICFNNSLQRVGSNINLNTPTQERSGVIDVLVT